MAGVLRQAVRGVAVARSMRLQAVTFVRPYSREIPSLEEHATGLEKKELDAIARGNLDPFDMEPMKRGVGTKEQPNLVKSVEDKRMIGCVCDEDDVAIKYMWLHKNEMKRCSCGYWFKLIDTEPL